MRRKNTKLRKINIASILIFIFVAVFYLVHEKSTLSRSTGDGLVPVISVSDGDSVSVLIARKKEEVRLIGIDAPEMAQKPWGDESKKHLESFLSSSGWKVKLEYDVEKRDKYGRILAYMRTADEKFINLLMIKSGYAMLYTVPPNVKYVHELKAAQEEARNGKLGIWSDNGLKERPGDYRREHPRV
jgi:micrococcal nuclease